MKIYFLSSQPCCLTVNDVFFGKVDLFERFAEISLKDGLFLRFIPENAQPISFFLNEDVRFSPPNGCQVYVLPDALAIYACEFPSCDLTLRPIAQSRFETSVITVFSQGGVQVSIETENGLFISTLPPSFAKAELSFHGGLFFIQSPDSLAIYTQKGERVFLEKITSFSVEQDVLSVVLPLSERLGRTAECAFNICETGLTRTKYALRQRQTPNAEDDLLAFAFFESVLLGEEYAFFLCDELKPRAATLKEYLGDFCSVTVCNSPLRCGLVYQKAERLFEVKYFTVAVENGKITDIQG